MTSRSPPPPSHPPRQNKTSMVLSGAGSVPCSRRSDYRRKASALLFFRWPASVGPRRLPPPPPLCRHQNLFFFFFFGAIAAAAAGSHFKSRGRRYSAICRGRRGAIKKKNKSKNKDEKKNSVGDEVTLDARRCDGGRQTGRRPVVSRLPAAARSACRRRRRRLVWRTGQCHGVCGRPASQAAGSLTRLRFHC